jgi:hypothetical protein
VGAEPGDGFVDALLEGGFGVSEEGVGFVHGRYVVGDHAAVSGGGDVGAAGGRSAGLRPDSGSVVGYGLPVAQWE